MINKLINQFLVLFADMLTHLVSFTVNSACIMGLGQDEEPHSLKRFKKPN